MQSQATANRGPLCVARGYGIKIHVLYGHLVVEDGVGRDRRARRYARGVTKLARLVLIGHTGFVTLEALRWLQDNEVVLLQFDEDVQLVMASAAQGTDLPGLRRAQALAARGPAGLQVAREVLAQKVRGQASVAAELPDSTETVGYLHRSVEEIETADSVEHALAVEAAAAEAYWAQWSDLQIRFARADIQRLPEHWLRVSPRRSRISDSQRRATDPANAILNYLYALLEAEATIACQIVGLDPGLGIWHTDRRKRASLALDLMEACRPIVDAYLLALITQRTLSKRDFIQTREGGCRLNPRMTSQLAESTGVWREHVAPVVEQAAHILADHAQHPVRQTTPLTRANQRNVWTARGSTKDRAASSMPTLPSSCRDCGAELNNRRHRYCGACRKERWAESQVHGRDSAGAVLSQLRAEQRDPAHGGRAGKIRGRKNAAHQRAIHDWGGERPDSRVFWETIFPGLADIPISDLAEATGLSDHYCSLIRLGKKVPHARHWETMRTLASG